MADWNATDLTFTDISVEEYREYRFAGGERVRVEHPTHLHVSGSGGHRIATRDGRGFYIPAGFIAVTWKPIDGNPIFVT